MAAFGRRRQLGQAIALIALIIVVLFGFLGLAVDGGRGYLDRRELQASVDAAALAAAYNYMNNNDYTQAEQAATNQYANNERLYMTPTCSGYGTLSVSCSFGDPTNQTLTLTVVNHSIAGVTFSATGTHHIGVTIMQLLGSSTMAIGATATALARRAGTNGAAIQTLSPSCNGSLTFTGNSTTTLTGDIWSNGGVNDSGSAGGSVGGNVVGVCSAPPPPFLTAPWTVTGSQANGWTMPDPGYSPLALNAANQSWNSANCAGECPGTYNTDPHLTGGAGCYFLEGGVYDFAQGYTQLGGFVSNELRPPDEPNIAPSNQPNTTTLSGNLSGNNVTSITVGPLPGPIPLNSSITVGGQTFTVSSSAIAGATTISINKQNVSGSIPSGSLLSVRAVHQFWDSVVTCSGSFKAEAVGNTNNLSGTWSVEVTAVRWEPYSCVGLAASASCFIRESAPSMCKTVTLGSSTNIKVTAVSAVPGAQYLNVYLAQNGSCSGLAYLARFQNTANSSVTINSSSFPAGWPSGQASPPDPERLPLSSNLPNADPAAGTPPRGDLGNEYQCVDPTTGNNVVCSPTTVTPGAVVFYIPSGGCVDLRAGGDIYIFTGNQYQRVVLYEPGPEQSSQPNTCSNSINGHDFTSLIGIFYIPAAGVTINGTSSYQATIAGGVIAWTATIQGNENLAIKADASLRAWPSTVRLTQ